MTTKRKDRRIKPEKARRAAGSAFEMISLACLEPNDVDNIDEPMLKVRASHPWVLCRSAQTRGEVWVIGQRFDFDGKARVDLYDRDGPNGDDHIGTAVIRAGGAGRQRKVLLEGAGASYELKYRVIR